MSKKTRAKLIGPFLLILGAFGLFGGYQQSVKAGRIKQEGVVTPANLVEQHIRSGRRGSQTHLMTVQYTPEGKGTFQKEFSVSKPVYEAAGLGESLKVRHLPSDPEIAEIEGSPDNGSGGFIFGGIMLAIGGFVSFLGFRNTDPAPAV